MRNDIKDRVKKLIINTDKKRIVIFLGLAGMLLILLSELLPDNKTVKDTKSSNEGNEFDSSENYGNELEAQLSDILSHISGVGDTEIMLTLDGTTEYIYAEETEQDNDVTDTTKRENYKNKIVITEKGGEKNALVKKMIKPQVKGVLIACSGGDDVHIKEQVIGAVSAVLGIPAARVYVVKLDKNT